MTAPIEVLGAAEMKVTGLTLQFGGGELIGCTKGLEDDRCWFERHVGRDHRSRKPIGGERVNFDQPPERGLIRLMAVKQITAGHRVRVPVYAPRSVLLNSEAAGRAAFELAHETHPWLAEAERTWENMP